MVLQPGFWSGSCSNCQEWRGTCQLPISGEEELLIRNLYTGHLSFTKICKLLLDVRLVVVPADEVSHKVVISWDPHHNRFKLESGNMVEEFSQTLLHLGVLGFLAVDCLYNCHIITVEGNSQASPVVTPGLDRDDENEKL